MANENQQTLKDDHHRLRFAAERSVRYHQHRDRFFDCLQNLMAIIALIFAAAVAATLLQHLPSWVSVLAGGAVLLASILSLFYGVVDGIYLHRDLARRWQELLQELVAVPATGEEMNRLKQKRLAIEMKEPPVRQVLDVICHNEVVRAEGHDAAELVRIGWLARLLANFVDIGHINCKSRAAHADGLTLPGEAI